MKDLPTLGSNFDGKPPREFCRSAICGGFMGLLMCIKEHIRLRMKPLDRRSIYGGKQPSAIQAFSGRIQQLRAAPSRRTERHPVSGQKGQCKHLLAWTTRDVQFISLGT